MIAKKSINSIRNKKKSKKRIKNKKKIIKKE